MKYVKQLLVILAVTLAGEALHAVIPLPIPAGIYGMVILFLGLETRLIRLEHVRETGKFLVEIMPVLFIPAGVGLLESWGVLQPMLVPALVITVVTLIAVLAVTGGLSQWIIRRKGAQHE